MRPRLRLAAAPPGVRAERRHDRRPGHPLRAPGDRPVGAAHRGPRRRRRRRRRPPRAARHRAALPGEGQPDDRGAAFPVELEPRRRRRHDHPAAEPRRPHLRPAGATRRGERIAATCPEWTDLSVHDPGHGAGRGVRLPDREHAVPAQPAAREGLRRLPQPARRAAPAARGRERGARAATRRARGTGRSPSRPAPGSPSRAAEARRAGVRDRGGGTRRRRRPTATVVAHHCERIDGELRRHRRRQPGPGLHRGRVRR